MPSNAKGAEAGVSTRAFANASGGAGAGVSARAFANMSGGASANADNMGAGAAVGVGAAVGSGAAVSANAAVGVDTNAAVDANSAVSAKAAIGSAASVTASVGAPDKNAPIGVFDSGLGGLTAVRELRRLLPDEDIIYFGDTGRVPYGTRGVATIVQYAKQDIAFLLDQHVKYIMAACGTVSSTLPRAYSAALPVPYMGVVDSAAAAAVRATHTGRIGVIGTPATVTSGSYDAAICALLPTAQITATGCPLFVPLVENGYFGKDNQVTRLVAQDYLRNMLLANVDTLILGCTHYPLIADIIADIMGPAVTLIDPGAEMAKSAKSALASANLLRMGAGAGAQPHSASATSSSGKPAAPKGSASYYVSDSTESFARLSDWFLGSYAGGSITQISVDGYSV